MAPLSRRKVGRLVLLVLASLVLGPVLVLAGVFWFLTTSPGNAWLLDRGLEAVNAALPGARLELDGFRTDLLTEATARDVRLVGELGEAGERQLVYVEELHLEWRLLPLLRRTVHLDSVTLVRAEVVVTELPDGTLDILRALGLGGEPEEEPEPAEPWAGLPVDLVVEDVSITGGEVTYSTGDLDAALKGLDVEGAVALRGADIHVEGFDLSVMGTLATADGETTSWPLGISADVSLVDGDLTLAPLGLRAGRARLELDGSVTAAQSRPGFALSLSLAGLHPEDLEPLLGELPVRGPFSLHASLMGPLRALEIRSNLRTPAGEIGVGLGANLEQDPVAWRLQGLLTALELHRFVDGPPEPTAIAGSWDLEGEGRGWPDAMTASGDVSLAESVVGPLVVRSLSGRVSLEDAGLAVGLDLRSSLGRARLTGRIDLTTMGGRLRLDADGIPLEAAADVGLLDLAGVGSVQAEARLIPAGDARLVEMEGEISVEGLRYGELLRVEQTATTLEARLEEGSWQAAGHLTVRELETGEVVTRLVEGPWQVSGGGEAVDWGADLLLEEIVGGGVDVAELRVAAAGSAGDETLAGQGEIHGRSLSLPLEMVMDRLAGTLALDGDRLVADLSGHDPSGEEVLRLDAGMDLGSGDLRVERLLVAPTPALTLESLEPLQARLLEHGVEGLRARLAVAGGTMTLDGGLDLAGDLGLELSAQGVALAPFAELLPALPGGLAGGVSLEMAVSGTSDRVLVEGGVAVRDFRVPGALVRLDGDLSVRPLPDGLGVELAIHEPDGGPPGNMLWAEASLPARLSMDGLDLDLDAPWGLDLLVAPGGTDRWRRVAMLTELPDAHLSAHLEVGGTPRAVSTRLGAVVELPATGGTGRVRAEVQVRQEGEDMSLAASLSEGLHEQATLSGAAHTMLPELVASLMESGSLADDLDLAKALVDSMELNLVALGVEVDTLRNFAPLPAAVAGRLTGGLQVRGDPSSPVVEGGLALQDGVIGELPVAPAFLVLIPEDDGYRVDVEIGFRDGSLALRGLLPVGLHLPDDEQLDPGVTPSQMLDLEVEGSQVPLQFITALLPGVSGGEGALQVTGQVGGTLSEPSLALALEMEDASFRWVDGGLELERVNLAARLEDDMFHLDHLSLITLPITPGGRSLGRGSVSASGTVQLQEMEPHGVSLDLKFEEAWLVNRPDLRLAVAGAVGLRGFWPELLVEGDLSIRDARVVLDEASWMDAAPMALDPIMVVHRRSAAPVAPVEDEGEPEAPPWYAPMKVELALDLARNARIDMRMALDDRFGAIYAALATVVLEAQLDGRLVLGMAGGDATLRGEVQTVRGHTEILGSRFDISSGTVAFAGDPTDPILSITARHDARQYGEVRVDISGSKDDISLGFRSDDYPDETDIAAILVLGRPISEMSGEQAQGSADLVSLAAGALVGELERTLGAGVDLLEIQAGVDGPSVAVGQALSRDMFLILSVRPEADVDQGENVTEVTVEWMLTRHLTLEISTGDQGASSADVIRNWRF